MVGDGFFSTGRRLAPEIQQQLVVFAQQQGAPAPELLAAGEGVMLRQGDQVELLARGAESIPRPDELLAGPLGGGLRAEVQDHGPYRGPGERAVLVVSGQTTPVVIAQRG